MLCRPHQNKRVRHLVESKGLYREYRPDMAGFQERKELVKEAADITTPLANYSSCCAREIDHIPCQSLPQSRSFLMAVGHIQGQVQCPK